MEAKPANKISYKIIDATLMNVNLRLYTMPGLVAGGGFPEAEPQPLAPQPGDLGRPSCRTRRRPATDCGHASGT